MDTLMRMQASHAVDLARVEAEFGFAEMPVVSFADLYAGKILAALTPSIRAICSMRGTCSRIKE